jgi:hypothetical protein
MFKFIFIHLFLLSNLLAKETCSPIDLRERIGPARDQGISMWCYAHSAADLVSQKLGQNVSAMDLATTYLLADESKLDLANPLISTYLKSDPDFFRRLKKWRRDEIGAYEANRFFTEKGLFYLGGYDQDAILLSSIHGFCPEVELPGSDALFHSYLAQLEAFAKKQCGVGGIIQCQIKAPIKMGEIDDPNSKALGFLFQSWVDQKCQHRIKPHSTFIARSYDVAESIEEYQQKIKSGELKVNQVLKKMMKEIDRNLEKNRAVSIGYDLSDITAPDEENLQKNTPPTPVDHSSVIAARRIINGQCRYFIRTHLGNNCAYYDHLNPYCEKDAGGVWVLPNEIPSLYAVIHLE